ncbi:MAG: response regulator transcription factor [Acidimicrobiales bacterium]
MWILVVEDEELIADAIKMGLEAEGFAVDVTGRGDEGLFKAQTNDYDAIILDIMLPGLNGYKVCRELREAGNTTPILMLTAKDGAYDEAEGIDLGADDYVTKPFNWVVLLARVRAIIRRSDGRPAGADVTTELRADDLVLNPAAHTVVRGDVPIDLTPREFALLQYLLHRKGEVVSKRELLDHVWGEPDADDLNVTQVYAGYLRRKVDDPFGTKTIQTVRGIGYRVVETGTR